MKTHPPIRILAVEDDPTSSKLLGELLSREQTELTLARSAEDAMEILRHQSFDLIFCDLCLPKADGIALAEYIRATTHGSKVTLVATSVFDEEILSDLIRMAGFDGFIQKPINQATLSAQLFEIHERKRVAQAQPQTLRGPQA